MRNVIAFADEFGNNSFDTINQGSHFIVASVIVNLDELDEFESKCNEIRRKYFQTGEIKSSKVKDNYKRRLLILDSFKDLNFSIYAVVVDKNKLFGEGFKYKKSFYKYLNGILYKELYRSFPKLELKVDEHGGNDFMLSFKKYVEINHIRNLFSGSEFEIKKSHNEIGVQIADFIAGTLGYIYDETKKSDYSQDFLKLISDKLISINHFPKKYNVNEYKEEDFSNEFDSTIARLSIQRIFDYIDTIELNSESKIDQMNLMKLLVLFHQSNHSKKYATSNEFIKHLNVNRKNKLTKEQFTNLIGLLRDKGLLIASSRDGYKIPTSVLELKKYIKHGNNIIFPLLRRIEECRNAILLATNNSFDILNEKEFEKLKDILK